jgi:dihydroorotate dehydrogenase electron transfer subunit
MQESEAGILRTDTLGDNKYLVTLDCGQIARESSPGQFLQIRTGQGSDPFLRRTFSISGTDPVKGELNILFQVVGNGTEILCGLKRGRSVNIIGPLGKGFDFNVQREGTALLIGGGIGLAPLLFLSDRMKASGITHSFIFGARNLSGINSVRNFLPDGCIYSTDDGSEGYCGYVHEILDINIGTFSPYAIYTCGPEPMMRAVARVAHKNGVPCQVSLEERMACGIGACFGCAVPHIDGRMVRTCVEGPVFDSREVFFERN